MSLAERTRQAARERPWLVAALRAGVVNYTAAARHLDVDGETDAVATALRRYAEGIDRMDPVADARVSMESGVGLVDGSSSDDVLSVGDASFRSGDGSLTAIVARGTIDPAALATVCGRLWIADVSIEAAGATDGELAVVVDRRQGADALRIVEDALSS